MQKIVNNEKIKEYLSTHQLDDMFPEDVVRHMYLTEYEKGENVVQIGNHFESFYILLEGKLKVYTILENGKKVLYRFHNPLSFIGDLEFVNDHPSSANFEALVTSLLICVPMDILRKYMIRSPEFLILINRSIAEKFRTSSVISSMNLMYPLENRVASYLLSMSQIKNQGLIEEFRVVTISEMADLLCTSYRHLSRVLSEFEEQGIIERKRGKIKMNDYKKIEELSIGLFE